MNIEEAIKILDYKINMYKEDVFIGDLDKTNIEAIKKVLEEIERLNNIINELEKWIDEYYKSNRKWFNTELSSHDKRYYEREYINTEAMLIKFDKQLKELKGVDKE